MKKKNLKKKGKRKLALHPICWAIRGRFFNTSLDFSAER